MSSVHTPTPENADFAITIPGDGDPAVAASVGALQTIADRAQWIREQLNDGRILAALGGGWKTVTLPGAYNVYGLACEQIPVTAEGGPTSIMCAVGTDVMYMSEDDGENWSDKESTSVTLTAVAIGKMIAADSGWIALAVGSSGKYRANYRKAGVNVITAIAAGTVSGTPNFTKVIWDPYYVSGSALRFWACSSIGLYSIILEAGVGLPTTAQVSAFATHDVVVLPSGRVVAWQTDGAAVSRLAYTDDGTTMVPGASMAAYGTTERLMVWDAFAERLVLADGENNLAISTSGATIVSDHTYSALSVVKVFAWRGRALIAYAYSNAAAPTAIGTIFLRRASAWSFAITDPALFRAINVPATGFFLNAAACGSSRFVSPLDASGTILLSNFIAPRD